jgi:hypothetical protein
MPAALTDELGDRDTLFHVHEYIIGILMRKL